MYLHLRHFPTFLEKCIIFSPHSPVFFLFHTITRILIFFQGVSSLIPLFYSLLSFLFTFSFASCNTLLSLSIIFSLQFITNLEFSLYRTPDIKSHFTVPKFSLINFLTVILYFNPSFRFSSVLLHK